MPSHHKLQQQMGFVDPPDLILGRSDLKDFHVFSLTWPSQGQHRHILASSEHLPMAGLSAPLRQGAAASFFFSKKRSGFVLILVQGRHFFEFLRNFPGESPFFSSCLHSVPSVEYLCNLTMEVNYAEPML